MLSKMDKVDPVALLVQQARLDSDKMNADLALLQEKMDADRFSDDYDSEDCSDMEEESKQVWTEVKTAQAQL